MVTVRSRNIKGAEVAPSPWENKEVMKCKAEQSSKFITQSLWRCFWSWIPFFDRSAAQSDYTCSPLALWGIIRASREWRDTAWDRVADLPDTAVSALAIKKMVALVVNHIIYSVVSSHTSVYLFWRVSITHVCCSEFRVSIKAFGSYCGCMSVKVRYPIVPSHTASDRIISSPRNFHSLRVYPQVFQRWALSSDKVSRRWHIVETKWKAHLGLLLSGL